MVSEWGISPLQIDEQWTNRQFWMFGERLNERLMRRSGHHGGSDGQMTFDGFIDQIRGKR